MTIVEKSQNVVGQRPICISIFIQFRESDTSGQWPVWISHCVNEAGGRLCNEIFGICGFFKVSSVLRLFYPIRIQAENSNRRENVCDLNSLVSKQVSYTFYKLLVKTHMRLNEMQVNKWRDDEITYAWKKIIIWMNGKK